MGKSILWKIIILQTLQIKCPHNNSDHVNTFWRSQLTCRIQGLATKQV